MTSWTRVLPHQICTFGLDHQGRKTRRRNAQNKSNITMNIQHLHQPTCELENAPVSQAPVWRPKTHLTSSPCRASEISSNTVPQNPNNIEDFYGGRKLVTDPPPPLEYEPQPVKTAFIIMSRYVPLRNTETCVYKILSTKRNFRVFLFFFFSWWMYLKLWPKSPNNCHERLKLMRGWHHAKCRTKCQYLGFARVQKSVTQFP